MPKRSIFESLLKKLKGSRRTQGEILAAIRRRRAKHPYDPNIPDSLQLLREDRDR